MTSFDILLDLVKFLYEKYVINVEMSGFDWKQKEQDEL